MSTKCSLAWGESFHLYNEVMEDDSVYLTLRGDIEFDVHSREVTVKIPIDIWEHIRHYGGFAPRYHLMDDRELFAYVTAQVDKRTEEWTANPKGLLAFAGSLVYGLASDPREEQIQHGFECLVRQRTEEREILARIQALRDAHKR